MYLPNTIPAYGTSIDDIRLSSPSIHPPFSILRLWPILGHTYNTAQQSIRNPQHQRITQKPKAPTTQHFHVKHIRSTAEICLPPPPATMTTALATSAAGAIASSCIAVAGGAVSTKLNNNVAMSFGNSHFFSSSILSLQSSSAVVNVQRPARRTNLVVCGKVSEVLEALIVSICP